MNAHLCVSLCVPHVCLVPVQDRRGHHTPWNWSCKWFWYDDRDRTWVLCKNSKYSQPLSHANPKSYLVYGGHLLLCNTLKYTCVLMWLAKLSSHLSLGLGDIHFKTCLTLITLSQILILYFFLNLNYTYYLCVRVCCVCECVCTGTHCGICMEVRGQLWGVRALLCGSQGLNPGCRACWSVP